MKQFDYIVVGKGISGTWLAYYLTKLGKSLVIFDKPKSNSPSRIASGIINPVTGRRVVTTWLADEIIPFAMQAYTHWQNETNSSYFKALPLVNFHASEQMQQAFKQRIEENNPYIQSDYNSSSFRDYFHYHYGYSTINSVYVVNMPEFIYDTTNYLQDKATILSEEFRHEQIQFLDDCVLYKDYKALKVIFCDGINGINIPWFNLLSFAFNKGEALIADIPNLPSDYLFKLQFTITPWSDNKFWIGSSFEWNFEDDLPQENFKQKVISHLQQWLKLPFYITNHVSSIRPANIERRPFVGVHPQHTQVGILNGMGSKGCSLAPYFAHQLAQHLVCNLPITPEANVKRFSKTLLRQV